MRPPEWRLWLWLAVSSGAICAGCNTLDDPSDHDLSNPGFSDSFSPPRPSAGFGVAGRSGSGGFVAAGSAADSGMAGRGAAGFSGSGVAPISPFTGADSGQDADGGQEEDASL